MSKKKIRQTVKIILDELSNRRDEEREREVQRINQLGELLAVGRTEATGDSSEKVAGFVYPPIVPDSSDDAMKSFEEDDYSYTVSITWLDRVKQWLGLSYSVKYEKRYWGYRKLKGKVKKIGRMLLMMYAALFFGFLSGLGLLSLLYTIADRFR